MAIARLLVAGVLVAGGLVLGAFAALGYLDPNWTQNQLAAASKREPASEPKSSISVFRRTRFVAAEAETPPRSKPLAAKPSSKQPQRAIEPTPVERKHIVKASATRKAAEKPAKQPAQVQQAAALQWPWNLFGN
jgi:hypothetical protein